MASDTSDILTREVNQEPHLGHMEVLMEECEPVHHPLHTQLSSSYCQITQVCKEAGVEKVLCSLPLECGGWSWME